MAETVTIDPKANELFQTCADAAEALAASVDATATAATNLLAASIAAGVMSGELSEEDALALLGRALYTLPGAYHNLLRQMREHKRHGHA